MRDAFQRSAITANACHPRIAMATEYLTQATLPTSETCIGLLGKDRLGVGDRRTKRIDLALIGQIHKGRYSDGEFDQLLLNKHALRLELLLFLGKLLLLLGRQGPILGTASWYHTPFLLWDEPSYAIWE
jgi:hypothetical protein